MQEYYNVNFLLTNQNNERANQLLDSFINIYATNLYNLKKVKLLNVSPNHHFMEEFKDFIENYEEIENFILSNNKEIILPIDGIRAINILNNEEVPIYINPFLNYIDENVASFGIYTNSSDNKDNEAIYNKLNSINLNILNYGIIKGADKVKIFAPTTKKM